MSTKKNRLSFKVTNGIFAGYRIFLTKECVDNHIKQYGDQRPEIQSDDFWNKEVVDAMKSPGDVYPSSSLDEHKKVKFKKGCFVVYKERVEARCKFNGRELRFYVKIAIEVKKVRKGIEILTALYTDKVPDANRCKPIKNI